MIIIDSSSVLISSQSNIIKGKILHDKTFAAAAATANHFLCNVVKLPITGLPKRRFIKIEREEKRKMGKRQTEAKRKKELNTCKARVFPTCFI
jgi:hypothetical protein